MVSHFIQRSTQLRTLATVSLGAMLFFTAACSPQNSDVAAPPAEETTAAEPATESESAVDDEAVVAIAMTAEGRAFFLDGAGDSNPDIVVQQGDTVALTLCVTGGTHDWVVDEFDAATEVISAGGDCSTVEFVADQAGEFDYYCSVGNHRAEGMAGRFIVE
ncbi:blue (type 1) copper domain protein [Leptolyngbya sp. BL0902]|uniref:cupredoxin domain-containing protein n=1 Tax=Leptolyngbya sp. BL0902 TaxID=1115757 RepID=UPI0018E88A16|nr:cupredoxin domain-containing protein [Leptolyngbya sp. BL0902]QQE63496.1 blue (type 1) copper domain protein [Leptolyngbya sp. BL0902]